MTSTIKNELWEMGHNKFFLISLLVGTLIVCVDMLQNFATLMKWYSFTAGGVVREGLYSVNLFYRWIGVNLDTVGYAWFYLIFPLLAALPYSWSYCRDLKSGYTKQVATRVGKFNYYIAKTVVVFISGALVIGIPLMIDLLGSATFLPAVTPEILSMQSPVWSGNFLSALYYTQPWAYSIIAILMDMLWGGCIATLAMSIGFIIPNQLVGVLSPMLLLLLEDYFANIYMSNIAMCGREPLMISPLALLHIATVNSNPAWLIFGAMGTHFIIAVIIIANRGALHELY